MNQMMHSSPMNLNYVDLGNEMSQPLHASKSTLFQYFNETSVNNEETISNYGFDDEVDVLTCSRKEKFTDAT